MPDSNTFSPALEPIPSGDDRRQWVRHPVRGKTACYVNITAHKTIGPVEVQNLSRGGITLFFGKRYSPPLLTTIWLYHKVNQSWDKHEMEVVYLIRPQGMEMVVGGKFNKLLGDGELQGYLGPPDAL